MKPRRRVEKREYWTCTYPEHRHTKQANAARCIEQASWTDEKYARAIAMREAGATYIEIAERFGGSAIGMGNKLGSWRRRQHEQAREAKQAEALAKCQAAIDEIVRRGWGHYLWHDGDETKFRLFRPGIGPHGRPDIAAQERRLLGGLPPRQQIAQTWREMRAAMRKFRQDVAVLWPPSATALDKPETSANA